LEVSHLLLLISYVHYTLGAEPSYIEVKWKVVNPNPENPKTLRAKGKMESGPSGGKGGSSLPLQDGQAYVADKRS
jgi:hypothetical protein